MALRDRRTNIYFDLWCLVASGGLDICVSSTSFQKNYINWPQQPPTQRVSDISEKLDFRWSIPQKGTGIGHLGARDDQTIRISNLLTKWGCRGHWGHWGCWGHWGHWGCRGFEAWKTTTEDFRVIQEFEFSFIFMFWKKVFFGRITNYHIEFKHLFCRRLLRPINITFLKTDGRNSNVHTSWSH
jgi:hypothetical protein